MLPLHQSARPASLSWLSTTFRALSRDERGSYHITVLSSGFEPKPRYPRLMLPLHQLSILGRKASRTPVRLRASLVPILSHSKNPDDLLNHQSVLSATSSTTQLALAKRRLFSRWNYLYVGFQN